MSETSEDEHSEPSDTEQRMRDINKKATSSTAQSQSGTSPPIRKKPADGVIPP